MYNFVYYVIYNQQIQKGKSEWFSRCNGAGVAALSATMHGMFLISVTRRIVFKYLRISTENKDWGFVYWVSAIIFALTFWWFNSAKRTQLINDKLLTDKDPSRNGNIFKVLAILVIPVILIMIMTPPADNLNK